jgi:trehalose 6-phosphate phosphatase
MPDSGLLSPLAASPERTALIFDVDGTLAPIAARPELAEVPEETRAEVRRLVARYRLVACVSGRPAEQARGLVSVDRVRYVGNHGLELHPGAAGAAEAIARFRDEIADDWPVEDKGLALALHYRETPNEAAALAALDVIAKRAEAAGLHARYGRKVLEILPSVHADKGTAIAALLGESGARLGLYAGDDTTDLDAFRGLREAGLELAVCVAVASPEAPATLLEAADIAVDSPAELVALIRRL